MKDLIIDVLVIEEDRPAHIARHDITIDEVIEVLMGDYLFIRGRENRWLLIGPTEKERFLTIVLGERPQPNTYGLITARPARREERSFYIKRIFWSKYVPEEGGDEDENR